MVQTGDPLGKFFCLGFSVEKMYIKIKCKEINRNYGYSIQNVSKVKI